MSSKQDYQSDSLPISPPNSNRAQNVSASAPYFVTVPTPYLHGYVMGAYPPNGPLRVFDIASVEKTGKDFDYALPYSAQSLSEYGIGCKNRRAVQIAMLVTYIVGMFTFVPYVVSIALSLHLVKVGQIQRRRSEVLWFSFIELSMLIIATCLFWGYTDYGYNYGTDSDDVFWWGWIPLLAHFVFGLAFGIPRVHFCWTSNTQTEADYLSQSDRTFPETGSVREFRGLKVACVVTYILGFFTFVPHLVSLGFSLYMLKKGWISKRRGLVLACAVMESVGWFVAASLSWLTVGSCFDSDNNTQEYIYNGDLGSPNYNWYNFTNDRFENCSEVYFGWIFLVIWAVLAMVFGIIRVLITVRASPLEQMSSDQKHMASGEKVVSVNWSGKAGNAVA